MMQMHAESIKLLELIPNTIHSNILSNDCVAAFEWHEKGAILLEVLMLGYDILRLFT